MEDPFAVESLRKHVLHALVTTVLAPNLQHLWCPVSFVLELQWKVPGMDWNFA